MPCITLEQISINSIHILIDVVTMPMMCTQCILKCQSLCQNTTECVAASELHIGTTEISNETVWQQQLCFDLCVMEKRKLNQQTEQMVKRKQQDFLKINWDNEWRPKEPQSLLDRLLFIREKAFICCQCKEQKTKDHQEKVHHPLCEDTTPE